MKKTIKAWLLLTLAVLAGCQKEVTESADPITVTVLASTPADAVPVKTYLGKYNGHDNTVLWGKGEQMQLAITSGGTTAFAASAPTDAFNALPEAEFSFTIAPATAASYLYQGVYPASAVVAEGNADPTAYQVILPDEQHASAGLYDPSAFIMVAQPTAFTSKVTSWQAAFRRAVALNKMTLQGFPTEKAVSRVDIIASDGVALSGGRKMNLSTGESGAVYAGSPSVGVQFDEPLATLDKHIWFTSWGVELGAGKTLSVTVYTTDQCAYTKVIELTDEHPITLVEGCLNSFKVDMAGIEPDMSFFSGGNGSARNPWRIAKVADLTDLADYVASTDADNLHFRTDHYRQTADIDFAGGTHNAIGNTNAGDGCYFAGTFDGNGFKISHVAISNPNGNKAVGFFGYLDGAAHIHDITIENATVASTTWNNGILVGCVQNTSSAVVENCTATDSSISAAEANTGGIVGKLDGGTIRGCSFQGSVEATNSAKNGCGGITGYQNNNTTVENCHLLPGSNVTSAAIYVGGIVGQQNGGNILGCSVTGKTNTSVSGALNSVGGIVGYVCNNGNSRRIENCTVDCKEIKATQGRLGGLTGGIEAPCLVNRCVISADIINETNGSDSDDKGCVGGLIGYFYCNGKVMTVANSCFVQGIISNTSSTKGNVGGIAGSADAKSMNCLTIFNTCSMPTQVIGGSNNQNLAGIAGYCSDVTMRNCYSATPYTAYTFNGVVIDPGANQSNGCLYGWQRGGNNANNTPGGVVQDGYWISGFKAGRSSGSWTYTKYEQELTDAQMRGTGAVTRPSTGESYENFLAALNADASAWNANPPQPVKAATWVMGENGYPMPIGPDASDGVVKKKVSILGDSISTYQGYTPYPGNYQYPKGSYTDFTSVSQTWWHQLIYDKMTDATLEVNSSYTGTCVQETTSQGHPGYGFLHRYVELGDPDVILVNGGTNDAWSFHLPVGTLDFSKATDQLDEYQFAQAYDKLIRLLKAKYPKAQIACIIGDCVMDAQYTAYAQVIRDVCDHYELPYAQVVFANRAAVTYDNVHPNVEGMQEMAGQIWAAMGPVLEPGSGQVPQLEARVVNVESPRMKVYLPATGGTTHGLVVVCPGGGYSNTNGADGYEGAFYKDVFNEAGYALAVLYYTLPGGDYTKPMGDVEAALRLVRQKAGQWYVDPDKVGVMGFSAGGHLASWAATHLSGGARADFQVLFYPVITMGEGTHAGSRTQLLGNNPTAAQIALFSNEQHVSAATPRAFLTYADNDTTVPPAYNGGPYYDALTAAGVPVRREVYSNVTKPHGWHWGSFTFDGVGVSDGSRFEHLDEVLSALSSWLKTF